jgi:putative copper resistance protein D
LQEAVIETGRTAPSRRWLWIAAALALTIVVIITFVSGDVYRLLGDSDPGTVTTLGTTLLRLLADGCGSVCVGGLAFAVFVVPGRTSGTPSAGAYAALRVAGWAAAGWAAVSAMMVVFSPADASGQPVAKLLSPRVLFALIDATEEPKAWLVCLVVTVVLAVACRVVLSWRSNLLLLVLGVVALLPPVIVGHAEVGAWHDFATNAILWHVVAASVWVGALVALLAHLRRSGSGEERILGRYHRLTVLCWAVLGVSGIVDGLVLAGTGSSGYGLLVLVKLLAMVVLGALCVLLRRRFADPVKVWRLAVVELIVLSATMGVSVGLTHLVPPTFFTRPASAQESILGYEVPDAPSPARLLLGWRFDLIFGSVAIIAVVLYLLGMRRLRRRGDAWPPGRAVAWVCGWASVVVVTSSGVGVYAPSSFSMHMIAHMTLNMLAPVLLVLGGPITLAMRALPVAGKGNPAGPREWLVSAVQSPVARFLAHPLLVSVVFVGSYYVLYFSDLFGDAMLYHWSHQLMNAHFLVSGYLFYWIVIGIDTAPRTLPHLAKLGMLFAVMPFHAFFGVILMSKQTVIGYTFYHYLGMVWNTDLLGDQRLGGGIAWAGGEIPLLIVVIALLAQWARHDERTAKRSDRRIDAGDTDELDAYNAMLAQLSDRKL